MDELLADFLAETGEQLDQLDASLVRFEQQSDDAEMLNAIFRLAHTVKGTCGFLGLDRLAKLAHGAEALMGQYRDGASVTVEGVSAILASMDRIKMILAALERDGTEPPGTDEDLLGPLQDLVEATSSPLGPQAPVASAVEARAEPIQPEDEDPVDESPSADQAMAHAPAEPLPAMPMEAPSSEDEEVRGAESPDALTRAQTVRVSVDTLEHLMTTVSELVLTRNQLLDLVRHTEESEFKRPLQRLSHVTVELQDGIMKARMQPISLAWRKLPRLARELSLKLGKNIQLEMAGGETELDRQVLEQIKDPLTHMIRNAADHGLETPDERIAAGKHLQGRIRLSASQEGAYILIQVVDDGRGLDVEHVRAKALERGLATAGELGRMSDSEVLGFIFEPGFSTASAVSEISGRGVGMDVVRRNLEQIGGTIELESTSAKGTAFVIKIPLTLAIMSALIVEVAGTRFAIPQFGVVELVRTGEAVGHPVEAINDAVVLRLRDQLLPLLDVAPQLQLRDKAIDLEHMNGSGVTAVILQAGARRCGVIVDKVFHTEEIVVKPMSSVLRQLDMFCGNTILGDGSVIMIFDPNTLGQAAGAVDAEAAFAEGATPDEASESRTALLLFRAGSSTLKAVPLSLITRLEELTPGDIEQCDGRYVAQYRGSLMPLVPIGERVVRENGMQPLLVFTEGGVHAAIMVDEIVDIVEVPLAIDMQSEGPGILGAAIVQEQTVEILDISHYLAAIFDSGQAAGIGQAEDPRRLLLVDDSAFFRNMLEPLLTASGYVVKTAASGDEALAYKDNGERFDVVVTDIDMPEMDGIEFVTRFKADPSCAGVPVVGLSSRASHKLAERCREAGFESYVGKFDRQVLTRTLRACCEGRGEAA